jgi:acetate kinase
MMTSDFGPDSEVFSFPPSAGVTMTAPANVLVVNAGSSTVKFALFESAKRVISDTIQRAKGDSGSDELMRKLTGRRVDAVGHRVVHGGAKFTTPVIVTPDVLAEIESLSALAPLHNPPAVELIRTATRAWPGVPQVACFDTAFHATLPRVEQTFGIPRRFFDQGVRRYGFHGLSYEFVAGQLPRVSERAASGRTVVCHLGNGASLCGMREGKSQTTTMGFTPLDGLLMATRPGRLDPGVVLHLLKTGLSVEQVENVLEHESGLLGVSGVSPDIRKLLASSTPVAAEAVGLFCHVVAKEIASAAAVLGGLDALVFTAGIGENSPAVRHSVCEQLGWLGVKLDESQNEQHADRLHDSTSAVEVYRLATDEESVIARHTATLLGGTTP